MPRASVNRGGAQDIPHFLSSTRRVASSFEAPPSAEHLKMTIMMIYSRYNRRLEVPCR